MPTNPQHHTLVHSLRALLLVLVTSLALFLSQTAFSNGLISNLKEPNLASINQVTVSPPVPLITSMTPTVQRSGLLKITGSNFGNEQGTSTLKIGGQSTLVVYWTDSYILAHAAESTPTGAVEVVIANTNGIATAQINITARQVKERILWRAEAAGDYISGRPAIAPSGVPGAGTIYAATNAGFLYAWAPDGALKWIAPGASGDDPVSVGQDGTIYVASEERDANGVIGAAVNAFNPDGTRKWTFIDINSQTVRAGPNVGPDGKIYVIFRPHIDELGNHLGHNLAAIRPNGSLAWSVNRDFHRYGSMGKELSFGRQLPYIYFAFDVDPDPSAGFVNGGTFAYDFEGRLIWEKPGACCGVMAIPADEGVRHFGMRLNPQTGDIVYSFGFPPYGATPSGAPDAGPDNVHYIKGNSRLYAVNPDGSEKWHYDPLMADGSVIAINSPIVNSTNTSILLGGGGSYGQQSLFISVAPATGSEVWRQPIAFDPEFPPYGNIFFAGRAIFSADGNIGYLAGDVNGDQDLPFQQKYCYMYALNTSADVIPVNRPPEVSLTEPVTGSQIPKNTTVPVTASVQDDGAVNKVDFYYNSRGITHHLATDTTPPYSTNFQSTEPGTYGLYVVATDSGGLTGQSATAGIIVTNETPVVSWINPTSGDRVALPATLKLKAHASDADGTILKVQFTSSIGGTVGEDTTPNLNSEYGVDFVNPPPGIHTLSVLATDNDGSKQLAVITVTISSAPSPSPTPTPTPTATPTPTPTPSATPTPPPAPTPAQIQFSGGTYRVGESAGMVQLHVSRAGNTSTPVAIHYNTLDSISLNGCAAIEGLASPRCDFMPANGTFWFAPGETSKTILIPLIDDSYAEGTESFVVVLRDPVGAVIGSPATVSVTLDDNEFINGTNPIDEATFFTRQHYLDFLNREADDDGRTFWTNEIASCGADIRCLDNKSNHVSGAFFLSIEFQQTGFLVYRMHKVSFGNLPGAPVPVRFGEFLADTRKLGDGLIVGNLGWEALLEDNKQSFANEFVTRTGFQNVYPLNMPPSAYVDQLFSTAEVVPSLTERASIIAEFGNAATSSDTGARARALRRVAENSQLTTRETNKAFVLMQYFGYLRRNPNEMPDGNFDGYNFWLNKLNEFKGDFVAAEMVKAFRVSHEYRRRFGM